jgi:alpha-glucosidase
MRRPQERRHLITPRRLLALALALLGQNAANARIVESYAAEDVVSERIGDGIVQFHMNAEAKADRLPSLALVEAARYEGPKPETFGVVPSFARDRAGRFVTSVTIEPGTSLYGTGQAGGGLLRNGKVTEAWNTDAYGYGAKTKALYTSHPWVLAVRADGSAFGVLADTTYRVEIDLRGGITFRADGPAHPVIVIDGGGPKAVMESLGALTGTIEMPPRWALGYHQCRYSYFPDDRVREVAQGFRDRAIPADVIWMDIDYMDGFRCFTFDAEAFPNPSALNAELDSIGFSNVWMIDPGIKNEDGYFVHDQGDEIGAWVQRADGTEFNGEVWPGECVFPDFTNAKVREWWAGLYADFMANGIDGVWNDMNEPSVFNVESKTMPEDNHHRADAELGGPAPHARYHNVYGMLMVEASREGIMRVNPEKRPFVLSRANYMGGHRYGATWTGDNTSNWPHVEMSIPMTLNLSLSGQPFAGPDLGGFIHDGDGEMYARWFGFGSLLPFARGHTQKGNRDKEPWAFGPQVEATVRRALERRYRLMPHLYTLFEEAHRTGMPVARPLFFADPADAALRDVNGAFLLGDNLLVSADITKKRGGTHAMPSGDWRRVDFPSFDGGRDSDDPDQARLFVRGGGIVPTGPVHQHFGDRPDQRDELTLLVALDEHGHAEGELYEDAGEGWGFRDGAYLRTRYTARRDGDAVRVVAETIGGTDARPRRTLRVRLLTDDGEELVGEGRDGEAVVIPIR